MAYQPIQMPQPEGPGLFDAYMRAQEFKRQSSRDAADALLQQRNLDQQTFQNKRLTQQDRQQAYLKAVELAKSGDIEGAKTVLAPFADQPLSMGEEDVPGQKPQAPPMQGPPPGPPQGGSPMPDMLEFGGQLGPDQEQEAFNYQGPQTGPPDQEQEAFNYQGPPEPAAPQAPQGPPDLGAHAEALQNPLVAAAQATKKRKFLRGSMGGQEFNINPDAMRQEQQDRAVAQIDQAMAGVEDPKMLAVWKNRIRPAVLASTQAVDPNDIFRIIHNAASEENQAAGLAQRNDQFGQRLEDKQNQFAQSDITRRRGQDLGLQGRQAMVGAMTSTPLKEAAQATTALGRLDSQFDKWASKVDFKKMVQGQRALESAQANISSGNPVSEKEATVSLGRYFRGNVTEGEMHLLYGDLAGKLGDGYQQFVEKMWRGGLDAKQQQIVQQSADIAHNEYLHQMKTLYNSGRHEFGPGSGHENFASNTNAKFASLMTAAGMEDAPPLFGGGAEKMGVSLGEGNPMIERKKAAIQKASKPNPLQDKARDSAAVKWAKSHLNDKTPASDGAPNSAHAAEILKSNGM